MQRTERAYIRFFILLPFSLERMSLLNIFGNAYYRYGSSIRLRHCVILLRINVCQTYTYLEAGKSQFSPSNKFYNSLRHSSCILQCIICFVRVSGLTPYLKASQPNKTESLKAIFFAIKQLFEFIGCSYEESIYTHLSRSLFGLHLAHC